MAREFVTFATLLKGPLEIRAQLLDARKAEVEHDPDDSARLMRQAERDCLTLAKQIETRRLMSKATAGK